MTADPCTDPRATELMAIDDAVLSTLIGRFVDATRRASFASRGLAAAANETVWCGDAATSFKSSIGRMPRQLDQVLNSYYGVRVALEAYLAEVDRLKLRWTRATAAIEVAAGPHQAQAQLRRVSPAYEQACATGSRILDEFDAARSALCTSIATAAQHSITRGGVLGRPQAALVGPVSAPADVHRRHNGDGGVPVGGGGPPGHGHGQGNGHGHGSGAPVNVTGKLDRMEAYIRSVMGTRYVVGGGHSSFDPNGGLDCSGFVSGVLRSAGYLTAPRTTATLPGQARIVAGHGRYVTIYDRAAGPRDDHHVIIDFNGQFYEEGGGPASGGAPDVHRFTPSPEYLASFDRILHPAGM